MEKLFWSLFGMILFIALINNASALVWSGGGATMGASPNPEPTIIVLMGFGLLCLADFGRKIFGK